MYNSGYVHACSVRLYLQLFVGGPISYLLYLCLFAHSGVQHILCCIFLRLVYLMLPASLNSPFLIAPSVFSNVYLAHSGRFILSISAFIQVKIM